MKKLSKRKTEIINNMIGFAKGFLISAEVIYEARDIDRLLSAGIINHCQQTVEIALDLFLYINDVKPPKFHTIEKYQTNRTQKLLKKCILLEHSFIKEWTYLIEVVYKVRLPYVVKESKRIASADLGLDNFITLVNNTGIDPVLIKGADLKSINQYYNKEVAELASLAKKCNKKFTTKQIAEITGNRNNRVKNRLHEISRYVVNYLVENNIDTLVVGKNNNWKQNINIGKINNQKFVQIPHAMFINMLKYKCALAGIIFVETNEAYTSKASFLDGDKVPKKFSSKRKKALIFSGARICRGLYRTKNGNLINADVNGAYNIMIKVLVEKLSEQHNLQKQIGCLLIPKAFANGIVGAVLHPVRHKVA